MFELIIQSSADWGPDSRSLDARSGDSRSAAVS